jgi:hypothetical protein
MAALQNIVVKGAEINVKSRLSRALVRREALFVFPASAEAPRHGISPGAVWGGRWS